MEVPEILDRSAFDTPIDDSRRDQVRADRSLHCPPMRDESTIVVLEGDQTGQELLEEGLRVLAPDVIGVEFELIRYDLSLGNRRATKNAVVYEAAAAIREHGLGLKGATVTPEARGDIGSPNRILREEIGGQVIVRTGRRIPGVSVSYTHLTLSTNRE